MTIAKRLIGKWKATTDGEKLFHFLVSNVGQFRALDHLHSNVALEIIRGRDFMRFAEGAVVLHSFGRLMQAAKWYRSENIDHPEKGNKAIEDFAIESLGIAKSTCDSFYRLAPLALDAARAACDTSKTPSKSEKEKVNHACRWRYECYSCGTALDPLAPSTVIDENGKTIPNPRYLEYEHLWPHSYGGNSTAENLLPSCPYCNRAKGNMASWEWSPLQSFIPNYEGCTSAIDYGKHSGQIKIGLHMRVAMAYAKIYGTSLKDAYIAVDHRLDKFNLVNFDDTADFFNVRVDNFKHTGISFEDM